MKVDDLIKIACEELNIDVPTIRFGNMPTPTLKALYSPFNDSLMLSDDSIDKDSIFYITHELRHKWQWINHPEWFNRYKKAEDCESIDEYNEQLPEIDAHAYATYVCILLFDETPHLPVSENIHKKISKMAMEIGNELNQRNEES